MKRQRSGSSMLAPHESQPVRVENAATAPIVLKELDKLGYGGDRANLKARGEAAFRQMHGSGGGAISASVFANHAAQQWGWDQLTALAAFAACDLDHSGAMALHEYLLLLAATVHFGKSTVDQSSATLADVRARTLFTLYHMLHEADQADLAAGCLPEPFEITLGLEARTALLRDLCAADSHVRPTLEALEWHAPSDGSERELTFQQFRHDATNLFGKHHVSLVDARVLQPKPHVTSTTRLVLDPRAMQSARDKGRRQFTAQKQDVLDALPQPPMLAPAHSLVIGPRAVNDALELCPELRAPAGSDWRGPLAVPARSNAFEIAKLAVEKAQWLASDCLRMHTLLPTPPEGTRERAAHEKQQAAFAATSDDSDWLRGGEALWALLDTDDVVRAAARIRTLALAVAPILEAQPSLVRVSPPVKVFGDIHGQLRDLLDLFHTYGFPSHRASGDVESVSYVFNGDFVDRGAHQLEVVVLLFALKCLYPERIFLVRGNHEFREQNAAMGISGFVCEMQTRFAALPSRGGESGGAADGDADQEAAAAEATPDGSTAEEATEEAASGAAASSDGGRAGWLDLFDTIHRAFEWLPLAALVGGTALVLHGGIGDGDWGLTQLAHDVPRPLRTLRGAPLFVAQALWSDPSDSDAEMARGVHHNSARDPHLNDPAVMKRFGPDVTEAFCAREGVQLVVRSHQFVADGVKFMHSGRLVTVFSARNYVRAAKNDAALLLIAMDGHGHYRVRAKRLLHNRD